MDDQQIIGLVGQGGAFGALMLVIWKIGNALVATIKELRQEIADHTKRDVAAMGELQQDMAALNSKIDTALDITPIRQTKPRARTNPEGIQAGYYGPRKPPREDG